MGFVRILHRISSAGSTAIHPIHPAMGISRPNTDLGCGHILPLINTGRTQESWLLLLIGDRNLRKADAMYYCLLLCYKTDNTAALYTTALMREKVAVFNEKSSEVY